MPQTGTDALAQNAIGQFLLSALSLASKVQAGCALDHASLLVVEEMALNTLILGTALLALWQFPQVLGSEFLAMHLPQQLSATTMSQINNSSYVLYPVLAWLGTALTYFRPFMGKAMHLVQNRRRQDSQELAEAREFERLVSEDNPPNAIKAPLSLTARLKDSTLALAVAAISYVASHEASVAFPAIRPMEVYLQSLSDAAQQAFIEAYENTESTFFTATSVMGTSNAFASEYSNYFSGHSATVGIALGAALAYRAERYGEANVLEQQRMDAVLWAIILPTVWTVIARVLSLSHSPAAALNGFLLGIAIGYNGPAVAKTLEHAAKRCLAPAAAHQELLAATRTSCSFSRVSEINSLQTALLESAKPAV